MALIDRMRMRRDELRKEQAWEAARPARVADWIRELTSLFDVLEGYLAEEISADCCNFLRTEKDARTEDLG